MRHHSCIDLLRWLLTGLLGREMQVVAAPESCESGQPPPRRAVLAPERVLLPPGLATSDVGRAAMAHAVAHLKYSVPGRPIGSLKPMSIAVISTLEDTRVERLLARELPGVRRWFDDAIGSCSLAADDLSFAGLLARLDRALAEPERIDGHFWVERARELFEVQAAIDLHDYDAFRRIGSVLANDLGQLRVPFRAQLYTVPAPHRDDNGYLWQLPDPPDPPMTVSFTSAARRPDEDRGNTPAETEESSLEVELARFCYPEWDARAGIQRDNWATVLERRPAWRVAVPRAPDHGIGRSRLVLRIPRRTARTSWRRAVEGEHLDLTAAVDTLVALRSRQSPDARLFRAPGVQAASSSVLVLLDLSESTNDCVSPGGPSLLALERAASLMLARAVGADGTADRLAVHGFHSDGRQNVGYYRLLDFDETLDARAEAVIAQAPGRWSTRMGAALRHASHCLQGESADRRGLLLVTDGAPSDVDSYAPAYLVEDARAAVHAARRTGLRVHALAVDPAADHYVRRIFGSGGYDIVDRPDMLPLRLRDAYMRLCHS
jgi:nitric oxide reductase NorD protein